MEVGGPHARNADPYLTSWTPKASREPRRIKGLYRSGVPGAKPRAVLPNSVQFDAASGEKMATDCRFRSFRSTMLHLRARGFAPVTQIGCKSLGDLAFGGSTASAVERLSGLVLLRPVACNWTALYSM